MVQVEPSLVLPYYVKGGLVQGRNLRDQQKLLLVGQSSCCCLFTRETPLLGPPGYRLVQRQDPVTDSFPESDRVESVPEVGPSQGQFGIEIGPGQQPRSASRDSISSSCSNHSSGPVEASSYEYPVPVVRRQQIGIEEQFFSRGMSPTSHYLPFGIQHPIFYWKDLTIAPH